jgi:hypothetical protein
MQGLVSDWCANLKLDLVWVAVTGFFALVSWASAVVIAYTKMSSDDSSMRCFICHDTLCAPFTLPCDRHACCYKCIWSHVNYSGAFTVSCTLRNECTVRSGCPICKPEFPTITLHHTPSRTTLSGLRRLPDIALNFMFPPTGEKHCPFEACSATFESAPELSSHVTECTARRVRCPHKDCAAWASLASGGLGAHVQQECRFVECRQCTSTGRLGEILVHEALERYESLRHAFPAGDAGVVVGEGRVFSFQRNARRMRNLDARLRTPPPSADTGDPHT